MEAAATLLAAVFVLGPLFLYPGLGWAALLLGAEGGPLVRLAQAIGMTLLIVPSVCLLLATVGLLHPVALLGSLGVLSVAPLASPTARLRLASDLRWLARPRTLLAAGIGAVVVGAIVIWPSHAQVGPGLLPHNSTVWYYANLAQVTAESWRFPGLLVEWGEQRPFHTDYLPVTAHTAAALQLLPTDLPLALELYRLAVLAAGTALAALLFRRWLPAWTAVLAACLLLATTRLDVRFLSYKPETFGLVIGLFVLWLADRTLAERSPRLGLLAVAGAGLVFLSHAEVFLVLGPSLAGLAAGHALLGEPVTAQLEGGNPRRRRRSTIAAAAGLAALVFLGGLALGTAANVAVTGSGRIVGYATSPPTQIDPLQPERIPAGWRFTEDPTWDFILAATSPARAGAPPPGRRPPLERFERLVPDDLLRVWPGLGADRAVQAGVLSVILLVPLVGSRWLARTQRRAVVTWLVFALGLAAGAFAFALLYETYVPLRVGPRRLFPYTLFLPVVFLALDLLLLQRLVHWAAGRLLAGRAHVARSAIGVTVVAVLALVIARAPLSQGPTAEEDESFRLERTGYDAYGWIAQNTPVGSRILASAYTDGSLAALTRRVGIVDGRAVYLEDAPFLREALEHLLGARVVFGAPAAPGAIDFLRDERVDYLLVTGPSADGRTLGGYPVFEVDHAALDAQPYVRLMLTFGDDRLRLYEVEADAAAGLSSAAPGSAAGLARAAAGSAAGPSRGVHSP